MVIWFFGTLRISKTPAFSPILVAALAICVCTRVSTEEGDEFSGFEGLPATFRLLVGSFDKEKPLAAASSPLFDSAELSSASTAFNASELTSGIMFLRKISK